MISGNVRNAVREYFVVYGMLNRIHDEFRAAGIEMDQDYEPAVSGQRRQLVEQYYSTLNFTDAMAEGKFLHLAEHVLLNLSHEQSQEAEETFERLIALLNLDGYEYVERHIRPIGQARVPGAIKSIAHRADARYVQTQIKRMEESAEADPRLAIGTAKELVETVCKTILSDRGQSIDPSWDLPKLFRATRDELELAPHDVPDTAAASKTIKQILGGLSSIVQCLAELRNPYGTGHGPEARAKGLRPRHARLAVGAAATLATFLWETHEGRPAKH